MDQDSFVRGAIDAGLERPPKRMRKGTRSCAECRRRKIRCKYLPGFEDCAQCSVRGSKCISQGPTGEDEVQEAPSPPAAAIGSATDLQPQRAPEARESDLEISSGSRPPLVSMLDRNSTLASVGQEEPDAPRKSNLCEILRSKLPSYDAIITALAKNGAWWESFRQKTRVVTQAGVIEPLLDFAAQAYTSTSAAKLGILIIAYGRSLGTDHEARRLFLLVDELVVSNLSVVSSMDGMECLVLLAKTYTDIGQPRRSWFMWRKGLATAQLLGFHRAVSAEPGRRQRIWLAIYHGDRFTSLLLGLPHGFSDSHILDGSSSGAVPPATFEGWVSRFVHDCAAIAGRVIESLLLCSKPSFATAMQLDEELEEAFRSAPPGWWDVPHQAPGRLSDMSGLVDKLLIHFFYFHVRMYTHLPFLRAGRLSPSHNVSRAACTDAARNLLETFITLRTKIHGVSMFDCQTTDFVGFTAAISLIIVNQGSDHQMKTSHDEHLVFQAEQIFQDLESDGCKVAAQCRHALTLLSHPPEGQSLEIAIPYFGTVKLTERPSPSQRSLNSQAQDVASVASAGSSSTTLAPVSVSNEMWHDEYFIDYSGYQNQGLSLGEENEGDGRHEDRIEAFLGLNVTDLDIDQDWSLFLT